MSKDLPSYEDFDGDESLPSIEDYITEENAEELPSVEDFIEEEKEVISEETVTIEDADRNTFAESMRKPTSCSGFSKKVP